MTHSLPVNQMVPGRQPSGEVGWPASQLIFRYLLWLSRSDPVWSSPREPARPSAPEPGCHATHCLHNVKCRFLWQPRQLSRYYSDFNEKRSAVHVKRDALATTRVI